MYFIIFRYLRMFWGIKISITKCERVEWKYDYFSNSVSNENMQHRV